MVQLDVISGFSGAGKSTLIRKLVNTVYRDSSAALLINEQGKLSLADSTFEGSASRLIKEISTGCICCSRQDLLIQALSELIKDRNFEHIILEPAGTARLADLIPFLQDMFRDFAPGQVQLSHIVYTIDTSSYKKRMLLSEDFFKSQLRNSPLIFLNRQESVHSETLEEIRQDIRRISPDCHFLSANLSNWQASALNGAISYARHILPILSKYQKPATAAGFEKANDFFDFPHDKNQ